MGNPAGFWVRFVASFVDGIVISIPVGLITLLATGKWDDDNSYSWIINLLYMVILPVVWYGYTVGKRLFGIRIEKVNGEKLGYGTMLMRTVVGGLAYLVTLGIGIIVSAFMVGLRQDKRSIHDLIAGTHVTYRKPDIGSEFE